MADIWREHLRGLARERRKRLRPEHRLPGLRAMAIAMGRPPPRFLRELPDGSIQELFDDGWRTIEVGGNGL